MTPKPDNAASREREAMHPARRVIFDQIMADFPTLTLAEALEAFRDAGG